MATTTTTAKSHAINDHHREALASTRRFVASIGPDQWELPTPCDEWDVRELVNHVIVGNLWAAELASGRTIDDVGDRLDGDHTRPDALGAYDRSATAAADAFDAEGALDAPCAVSYGPVPGSVYAGHRFIDVLIHGWDIATATGQPAVLDPHLVDACWKVVEPQLDQLQASTMFGDAPAAPPGDDPLAKLLAVLGRQP